MLLDSNIIIYAAQLENEFLREFIAENSPYVSALSYLEVLGYHQLTHQDKVYFEEFFTSSNFKTNQKDVLRRCHYCGNSFRL